MEARAWYLFGLAGTPLVTFLFHLVISRLFVSFTHKFSPLWVAISAIAASCAFMTGLMWNHHLRFLVNSREFFWACLYGALVFSGLAFSYFQIFAMTETSRRTRILRELLSRGFMSLKEIQQAYGPSGMLSVRLARMVELGQLKRTGVRYQIKGRLLLWIGKIMSFWARVLGYEERKGF